MNAEKIGQWLGAQMRNLRRWIRKRELQKLNRNGLNLTQTDVWGDEI